MEYSEKESKGLQEPKGYKFVTAEVLSHAIVAAPINTAFDFTDDTSEEEFVCGEPTDWCGAKIIKIFDENEGLFVIGSYGGDDTKAYDISSAMEGYNIDGCIEEILDDFLVKTSRAGIFCVEVTNENVKYLENAEKEQISDKRAREPKADKNNIERD